VQCEETATRTRDLQVTDGKSLPLAPGPPFKFKIISKKKYYQTANGQLLSGRGEGGLEMA